MGQQLRVLIVEDHVALGEALRLAVELDARFECVGVAGSVAEALELVAKGDPDAVVMDVRLPDGDGIEAAAAVKDARPETSVVVLTAGADPGALLRAAQAGASGFLPKETRIAAILDAVGRTTHGEPAVTASALQTLLASGRHLGAAGTGSPPLADGDRRMLALLAEGRDIGAVAAQLGATPESCRDRLRRIGAETRARSPLQILLTAAREGLLAREG
jgi:DNA-binding NarL/FixJ family response regulator